jgi:hypothetical protein
MFGFLSKWLEQRRRKRAAVDSAVRHFDATTGKSAHAGISCVIGEKAGRFIVRVCYGEVKPPRRAWYVVAPDGSIVDEISFEQAKEFGERLWR